MRVCSLHDSVDVIRCEASESGWPGHTRGAAATPRNNRDLWNLSFYELSLPGWPQVINFIIVF